MSDLRGSLRLCLVLEGLRKATEKPFISWTKWQEASEYVRKKINYKHLKYYAVSEYLTAVIFKKIHGYLKLLV